jgi:YgiT-type zinc finger domain
MKEPGQSEVIKMPHNYGDCYFCGGEVVEKIVELEYRWKGQLYIIEGVPVGVCQQCGEKYFTAQVSEAIDRSVKAKDIKRTVSVPVKKYMPVEAI